MVFGGGGFVHAIELAGGTALRAYLALQFAEIMAAPDFMNVLPGLIAYDDLHSQRVATVTNRISAIAGLGLNPQ